MKKKTFTQDQLVQAVHETNIIDLNVYNLNRRNHPTFSDGKPFVGPVLSPAKSHPIISLASQT